MLPKASLLNRDFFRLVPACLRAVFREKVHQELDEEEGGENWIFLTYRDDPLQWRKFSYRIRVRCVWIRVNDSR